MEVQKQALEDYRLSPQQAHLWLLHQSDCGYPYVAQCAVLIEGRLDVRKLKVAVEVAFERHEILRTCFSRLSETNLPLQVITDTGPSLNIVEDLSGLRAEQQETRIESLVWQAAQSPLSLSEGPSGYVSLVTLSPEKRAMLITLPALRADSAALTNLVREIGCSYAGGSSAALLEEPAQYADLSEWQNEILEAEECVLGRRYWRKKASSAAEAPRLFFEKKPGAKPHFEPRMLRSAFGADTRARLESIALGCEISFSVLLLACWQVLLWRNTRQSEITIGVAYDGRNYEELPEALGLFARHLPVACYVDEGSRFIDLARDVRGESLQAYKWQECFSWDDLTERANDLEALPFIPMCFEYTSQPPEIAFNSVTFSILKQHAYYDRFKIKLACAEAERAFAVDFHYDESAFSEESILLLAEQFRSLLQNLISKPDSTIGELCELSHAERSRLLVKFNDTTSDYLRRECGHRLFEKQVERSPDKAAAVFGRERVTYSTLNARANQLSHYLRRLGIGPDVLVGVYLERSIDMVTALLGVWKAGGAYVPMDTGYPKQRISFLLQDTQMPVIITQASLADSLPEAHAHLIRIDAEWGEISKQEREAPETGVDAEHLAYVIYTSGSTGQPKGVMIPHRGVVNYLTWAAEVYKIGEGEGSIVHSPIAFDLTVTSLFLPLVTGRSISLLAGGDIESLCAAVCGRGGGLVKITPAHLNALNQMIDGEHTPRVTTMVIGGEALLSQAVELWRSHSRQTKLINEYGPTETVVGCCVYEIARDEKLEGAVPIGKPIASTQAYVLDAHMRPMPAGVTGEIYIGGEGVARGYLNRADQTAENFVPDPFSAERGGRLYKTGDLARHLPDGNLEYVGRIDNQVKVRGYRIEAGEIEATLIQHPAVQEAVVVARDYGQNDKRLAAYLTVAKQGAPSAASLRGFLKERLPEYMIPAAFVTLERLPLTRNGKVERDKLPELDWAASHDAEYTAPGNDIEELLASIWRKVLNVSRVGIHDNYFMLGGDSIRLIKIVQEVRRYNVSVNAMDVLKNPTPHKLARLISLSRYESAAAASPPLHLIRLPEQVLRSLPDDVEDAYPLSKMQELVVAHYSNDHQRAGVYHVQNLFHVRDETLSLGAFKRALEIIAQRHPSLRTAFRINSTGVKYQAVRTRLALKITEDDIARLSGPEQELYVEAAMLSDRADLFDIDSDEPLLRFKIFLLSGKSMHVLLSIHHAITDGWGQMELMKEFVDLYSAIKNGAEVIAAPAANVYKEFIALEQEIIASKEAADFWRESLSGHASMALTELSNAARDDSAGVCRMCAFDPELAADLSDLARRLGVSLKVVYLSAYLDLIAEHVGGESATIGVVSNGRSERLSDPLRSVGLFFNIVPVCLEVRQAEKAAQMRMVQQRLIDIELYARYPLTQTIEDQRKGELFFATLNFLYFHNAREISSDSGLQVIGSKFYDKFHFPLNYVVSIDPFDQSAYLRVEYDRRYFSGADVDRLIDDYTRLLREAARGR